MAIELSAENKRDLIKETLNLSDEKNYGWIKDVYDDRVIVSYADGKIFEVAYEIDDDTQVTIGEKKEVIVTYTALGEFRNVEILRTGNFTDVSGREVSFKIDDLDALASNAAALSEELEPPLVSTHKDGTSASIESFGHVHGGILNNVRRVGEKLIGDFKGVPARAVALLGEVKKLRLSPEIYADYKDSEGQAFGPALKRISIVDIPAIKQMAGITEANLFEESPDQPTTWINLFEEPQATSETEKDEVDDMSVDKIKEAEERAAAAEEKANSALTRLAERDATDKKGIITEVVKKYTDGGLTPVAGEAITAFAESLDNSETIKLGEKETTQVKGFTDLLGVLFKLEDKGALTVKFGESAATSGATPAESNDDSIAKGIAKASPLPS